MTLWRESLVKKKTKENKKKTPSVVCCSVSIIMQCELDFILEGISSKFVLWRFSLVFVV